MDGTLSLLRYQLFSSGNPSDLSMQVLISVKLSVIPVVELSLLAISVAFGFVSWLRHISYKVSIGAGIGALLMASTALALGLSDAQNVFGLMAYYLLAVGVILALIEYRRKPMES